MALVTIVIMDGENDEVEVKLFAEPALPMNPENEDDVTGAQFMAAVMLKAAAKEAKRIDEGGCLGDDVEREWDVE